VSYAGFLVWHAGRMEMIRAMIFAFRRRKKKQ
jgi:hypothetical protein